MKNRYVIGVTGAKGRGKTSFTNVLTYLLTINGYSVTILHFADYIKQVARECFGRDIGKIHGKLSRKDRELLCKIGDSLRGIDPNCLINVVERQIKKSRGFVIVGDVRLKSEARMIKKYDGIIVKIDSNLYNRKETYLEDHLTETEIESIKPDFFIVNDGMFSDLITEAKKVVKRFIKRPCLLS